MESEKQADDKDLDAESDSSEDDIPQQSEPPEFYDPEMDSKDEQWMVEQRHGRRSDAILSCPGCLSTVCIDCQQHAVYPNQFRAMFVVNCRCA